MKKLLLILLFSTGLQAQSFNFNCVDYDAFINDNPFLDLEISEVYESYSLNDTIIINDVKWVFEHLYETDLDGVGEPNPSGGWCGTFYETPFENEYSWTYSDYFGKWWNSNGCGELPSTKGFPGLSLQTTGKGDNKIWMTIVYGQDNVIGQMQLTRLGDNFGHITHRVSHQPYGEVEYQGEYWGYSWFNVKTLNVYLKHEIITIATKEYNKL